VPEEIRIVTLFPDEDEVGRGHELRDERAARSRTGKRIGPDAMPAAVISAVVLLPEVFVRLVLDV
jgi:hypothetical protein